MASATTSTAFRVSDSTTSRKRSRSTRSPTSPSASTSAHHMHHHQQQQQERPRASTSAAHHRSRSSEQYSEYRPYPPRTSSHKVHRSFDSIYPRDRPRASNSKKQTAPLRISPDPPSLLAFASSFETLLDTQASKSSTHSAYSELVSFSTSNYPPSTLPNSALSDLIHSNATPSASSSSKSSFSSVSTSLVDNTIMTGSVATTAGLDLLGVLAEEVDWDPQQRGGAPHLAVQSNHEAKQKLWAGQILGSLGLIKPDGSRRGSFASLTSTALPKAEATGVAKLQPKQSKRGSSVEDPLNTMTLTKRTALFYENLYERLCAGIVPRAYIYPKLGRKWHDQDPTFAALALSISLLGLLGLTLPPAPTKGCGGDIDSELRQPFVMPSLTPRGQVTGELYSEAKPLIERILLLRLSSSGGGIGFGQTPTLETVLTSFFLSLALYNLDDGAGFTEWKDASFFRFCEAVTLAKILGLDQVRASTASVGVGGEVSEEVKVWMLLVRAERWWAEQKAGYACQMEARSEAVDSKKRVKTDEDYNDAQMSVKKQRRSETRTVEPLGFLTKLGFAGVRDDLLHRFHDLLDCWTRRCHSSSCRLDSEATVSIHDSLASLELFSHIHLAADPILVDLARQALRAKLWNACLHHNLVSTHAQGPLRPDQPLHIALDTLDLLEDLHQLVLRSLPAGAVEAEAAWEALQEIRDCVGKLPNGRFAAESFSFEQIEGSDESDEPSEGGSASAGERASWTTITRAAQSVMDNLDRFLGRAGTH
ncbi:uncharacterized protein UBRO_00099 [Ustilago bromivora]|uniref:Transcription factor domain-containing protein n=1 Tax=Ustilago bromivora TaxID=307758 RepID=A0A1K0H1S9_9BASI|nr:uncharacterized protein UBRO_00099 [Ustilago bromivora]